MRRIVLVSAGLVLSLCLITSVSAGAVGVESTPNASDQEVTPFAEEACPSGNVCAWPLNGYQGARGDSLCTSVTHVLGGEKASAKNRCANKASVFRKNAFLQFCLNPGESRSVTPFFNEIEITREGGRC